MIQSNKSWLFSCYKNEQERNTSNLVHINYDSDNKPLQFPSLKEQGCLIGYFLIKKPWRKMFHIPLAALSYINFTLLKSLCATSKKGIYLIVADLLMC